MSDIEQTPPTPEDLVGEAFFDGMRQGRNLERLDCEARQLKATTPVRGLEPPTYPQPGVPVPKDANADWMHWSHIPKPKTPEVGVEAPDRTTYDQQALRLEQIEKHVEDRLAELGRRIPGGLDRHLEQLYHADRVNTERWDGLRATMTTTTDDLQARLAALEGDDILRPLVADVQATLAELRQSRDAVKSAAAAVEKTAVGLGPAGEGTPASPVAFTVGILRYLERELETAIVHNSAYGIPGAASVTDGSYVRGLQDALDRVRDSLRAIS